MVNAAKRPTFAEAKPVTLSFQNEKLCPFNCHRSYTINEPYHPEAAPIKICFVADCLLTSAKILSKQLDPAVGDGILIGLFSFSFFMTTIPVD